MNANALIQPPRFRFGFRLLDLSSSSSVNPAPNQTSPTPTPTPFPSNTNTDSELPFWDHLAAIVLSVCYLLLCLSCAIQLLRTICHRHKIRSFRFGFLMSCLLWTLLRSIWWFAARHWWPVWIFYSLYFLPSALQIVTFSLLVMFYAKMVHRQRWAVLGRRFVSFCVLTNLLMICLTLSFAILLDRARHDQETQPNSPETKDTTDAEHFIDKLYYICSAVFFGALVFIAAIYIRALNQSRGAQQGTTRREVAVTAFIFIIFLSRAIWDLLAAFHPSDFFRSRIRESSSSSHAKLISGDAFALLFLWEIIPTLLVIIYFRDIPPAPDSYWNLFKARWKKYGCKAICCCCTGKETTGGTWDNDENTPYHHAPDSPSSSAPSFSTNSLTSSPALGHLSSSYDTISHYSGAYPYPNDNYSMDESSDATSLSTFHTPNQFLGAHSLLSHSPANALPNAHYVPSSPHHYAQQQHIQPHIQPYRAQLNASFGGSNSSFGSSMSASNRSAMPVPQPYKKSAAPPLMVSPHAQPQPQAQAPAPVPAGGSSRAVTVAATGAPANGYPSGSARSSRQAQALALAQAQAYAHAQASDASATESEDESMAQQQLRRHYREQIRRQQQQQQQQQQQSQPQPPQPPRRTAAPTGAAPTTAQFQQQASHIQSQAQTQSQSGYPYPSPHPVTRQSSSSRVPLTSSTASATGAAPSQPSVPAGAYRTSSSRAPVPVPVPVPSAQLDAESASRLLDSP